MTLPKYMELCNPILKVLQAKGGSLPVRELEVAVADILNLTQEDRTEMHNARKTKLSYRIAWARYYLKKSGLLESSIRGVSVLSEEGRKVKIV